MGAGTTDSRSEDWNQIMAEVIGPGFDDVLVLEAGKDAEMMDFAAIQRTAREMADAMALGHGRLEHKDVPEFGDLARRTELWLIAIIDQARAHRGREAQRLIARGEPDYCQKCHDAVDEAR